MGDVAAIVVFRDNAKTFEAKSRLGDNAGILGIVALALVERDASGSIRIPEGGDAGGGAATFGGGLIGLLVGALGGPVGALLGLTAGAVGGAIADAERDGRGLGVIESFAKLIPVGGNALILELDETSRASLDQAVGELDGTIMRRPLDEVLSELEAEDAAAEAAQKAARRELREQKRVERKEKHSERIEKLASRLHRGKNES